MRMLIAGGTASLILAAGPACAAPCAQADLVEFAVARVAAEFAFLPGAPCASMGKDVL